MSPYGGVLAAVRHKGGASEVAYLTLTATTVGVNQTVTLNRLTPVGTTAVIDWGDTNTTTVTDGYTTAITHVYAAAGAYSIKITNPDKILQIDLRDAQLSNFNTNQLKGVVTYFYVTSIKTSTLNSADMVNWRPTTWYCYSMPAGTYTINSADMVNWQPTNWYCYSMPAGTYTLNSADMVNWRPTTWNCFSMPVSTTWTLGASDFAGWISPLAFNISANALSQAQVDAVLSGLWTAFATRNVAAGTINVGGSNAAPDGIYQAQNPPTTGKERCYELVNDSGGINPTHKWTTVTYTT
jgi:hypothetical protein